MKYVLIILLICLIRVDVFGGDDFTEFYRSWIKVDATYGDNTELPDDNIYKTAYFKYTFNKPGKLFISTTYREKGNQYSFNITHSNLNIINGGGLLMNTLRVLRIVDTLVLLQPGPMGVNDPASIKLYFVPEEIYQASIPIKAGDVQSIINGDTIYTESSKLYAAYKGESFHDIISDAMRKAVNMQGRAAHFIATFIVLKSGIADSVKIMAGIDKNFDERFIKAFNKTKSNWIPAHLDNKNVNVKMRIDLKYLTMDQIMPAYFASQKANSAYNNKEYETALFFYDEAINSNPSDADMLYKRGMCRMNLGNLSAACEDWRKAKTLGITLQIDTLLEKYCK